VISAPSHDSLRWFRISEGQTTWVNHSKSAPTVTVSLHDADRRAVDVERDVKPVEKIIPIFEIAGHHLKKGAVHQRSDQ
jgi:hypothetical protein